MVGLNLTADYLGLVSATQFYLYHNLQNGIKNKNVLIFLVPLLLNGLLDDCNFFESS